MDTVWGDNVAQNIAFYVIAAIMVVGALKVVTTKNVVHAALYLVAVLTGMAGQFILLGAEFIAITQMLVYVGAIVVLFLFGIMLTRAQLGKDPDVDGTTVQKTSGVLVALVLLVVMGYAIYDRFEGVELAEERVQPTAMVADSIFSTYIVPFEAISVLLLAALIGAIVLARRD
ncbi:NADH-quinone oxidoreductase subunit J family protein [Actinomarinicola tropica]|nr:NADH-quinone oxidoreductase subunit J [Actinomarinicola tropica]